MPQLRRTAWDVALFIVSMLLVPVVILAIVVGVALGFLQGRDH